LASFFSGEKVVRREAAGKTVKKKETFACRGQNLSATFPLFALREIKIAVSTQGVWA
jgi:hypothetical protein